MRCYLPGVRCRLFAYGPADATAVPKLHHLLPHLNPDWFYLLVPAYRGCRGNTHTHIHLTALCPGLPGWAGTRKVKPIWILLKQETVSGSGISWAICKSAPRTSQITTPVPRFLQARCPSSFPLPISLTSSVLVLLLLCIDSDSVPPPRCFKISWKYQTLWAAVSYSVYYTMRQKKRNQFYLMNISSNTQCNLTKFGTVIVNEYYCHCYLLDLWNLH